MAGRFLGDIPQINIKTGLSSAGAKAQASMWSEVGDAFGQAKDMAVDIRKEQNIAKGKKKGAEFIEGGGDVKDLPQGRGAGDISYRKSAMDTYTSQLSADSSEEILRLQEENANNPEQLRASLNAYTDSTIDELPVEIRASVRQNIEMKALGAYTKTLGDYTTKQAKAQKNTRLLNLAKSQSILETLPIPQNEVEQMAFDTQMGEYAVNLDKMLENGDLTVEKYESRIKSITTARAKAHSMDMVNTQKEVEPTLLPKTYNSIMNGSTGNQYIDGLSQEERMTLVQGTLSLEQQTQAYEDSIQNRIEDEREDVRIATKTIKFADMAQTRDTSPEKVNELISLAQSPEEVVKVLSFSKAVNSNVKSSEQALKNINLKFNDGTLTQESLTGMFTENEVSVNDYEKWSKKLADLPTHLSNSLSMKSFRDRLKNSFPKQETNGFGIKVINETNTIIQDEAISEINDKMINGEIKTKAQLSEVINAKWIEVQSFKTQSVWEKQGIDFSSLPQQKQNTLTAVQKDSQYRNITTRMKTEIRKLKKLNSYKKLSVEKQTQKVNNIILEKLNNIQDENKKILYTKAIMIVGVDDE